MLDVHAGIILRDCSDVSLMSDGAVAEQKGIAVVGQL